MFAQAAATASTAAAAHARWPQRFVAPKKGFLSPGAAAYTGRVHVIDIGVPRRLLEAYCER